MPARKRSSGSRLARWLRRFVVMSAISAALSAWRQARLTANDRRFGEAHRRRPPGR